jgi:hypothetical protein
VSGQAGTRQDKPAHVRTSRHTSGQAGTLARGFSAYSVRPRHLTIFALCFTSANTGGKFWRYFSILSSSGDLRPAFALVAMAPGFKNVTPLGAYPAASSSGGPVSFPLVGYEYVAPKRKGTALVRTTGGRSSVRLSWVRKAATGTATVTLRLITLGNSKTNYSW